MNTNKNIELSIVIPMYNVESYIAILLKMLKEQIREQVEVILVNDGSSDGTLKVVNEFCGKNPLFTIYSQENKGASAARNLGIINSNGRYIAFVDADDTISDDYVSSILDMIALYSNYDMYITGFDIYDYQGEYYNSVNNETRTLVGKEKISEALFKNEIAAAISTAGKIINRDFLLKNELLFDTDCKKMEDGVFFSTCYCYLQSLLLYDYIGTHYMRHEGSLTDKHYINTPYCARRIIENYLYLNKEYMNDSELGKKWIFDRNSYLVDYQLEKIHNNKFDKQYTKECVLKVIMINMDKKFIEKKYNGFQKKMILATYETHKYIFYDIMKRVERMFLTAERLKNAMIRRLRIVS